MPLFLVIWSCALAGVVAGALITHWTLGGKDPLWSMLGSSLSVAAGGTYGVLRRRRRNAAASER